MRRYSWSNAKQMICVAVKKRQMNAYKLQEFSRRWASDIFISLCAEILYFLPRKIQLQQLYIRGQVLKTSMLTKEFEQRCQILSLGLYKEINRSFTISRLQCHALIYRQEFVVIPHDNPLLVVDLTVGDLELERTQICPRHHHRIESCLPLTSHNF